MNLISQTKASIIANVTKQMINKIKKQNTHAFFVDKKVDIDSPAWEAYLHERSSSDFPKQEKSPKQESKVDIEPQPDSIDDKKTEINVSSETDRQKHSFTGGVDPEKDLFIPQNIADVKRLAEIQKIALEMKMKSGELIDRRIVADMMSAISRVVSSYFVDFPRRFSTQICQMCDAVGMEKKIEELMSEPIAEGIRQLKKAAEKAAKVKVD